MATSVGWALRPSYYSRTRGGSPARTVRVPGSAERLELVDAEALGPHRHHLALVVAGQDRDLEPQGVGRLAAASASTTKTS